MPTIITPFVPGDDVALTAPDDIVNPADTYRVRVIHVYADTIRFTIDPTERAYVGGPLVVGADDIRRVSRPQRAPQRRSSRPRDTVRVTGPTHVQGASRYAAPQGDFDPTQVPAQGAGVLGRTHPRLGPYVGIAPYVGAQMWVCVGVQVGVDSQVAKVLSRSNAA